MSRELPACLRLSGRGGVWCPRRARSVARLGWVAGRVRHGFGHVAGKRTPVVSGADGLVAGAALDGLVLLDRGLVVVEVGLDLGRWLETRWLLASGAVAEVIGVR